MAFEAGKSGNPGGRPKKTLPDGTSLTDLAKRHTPEAIAALVRIVKDKKGDPRAQVQAATALLDRGWGRPSQMVELGGEVLSRAAEIDAAQRRVREYNDALDPVQRAARLASIFNDVEKQRGEPPTEIEYEPMRFLSPPPEEE